MAEKLSFDTVNLGDQLPTFTRSVDQEIIWKYAVASLDYNPVHVDPEWCSKTKHLGLGSTAAHGMMTMSFMASAITNWAYPVGGRIKLMECKFIKPVLPGYTITAGGTVIEKHPIGKGENFVVIDWYAENQDGEKVAVGKAEVVLP